MEVALKRLTLAFSILSLATAASVSAAIPAATDPTLVNVPQLPGGVILGITGLYLEPSPTNGDVDVASINIGNNPFASQFQSVGSDFSWGLGLNLGYIFPDTGNDINANYFYLDTDEQKNILAFTPNSVSAVNFFQNLTDNFNQVDIDNDYRINQIDLTAGQYINIGCRLRLHPNVGLRYAEVQRDMDTLFIDSTRQDSLGGEEESDFTGIGPLVGMDASYFLGMGVGVIAHVDSALLIGDLDTQTHALITLNQSGTPESFFYKLEQDSSNRTVPVTDMRLGLDYTYMVNDAQNSDFTFEVGYQASHYYHSIDRLAVNLSSISSNIIGRTTSDLGLSGPYVNITFHA